METIHINGVLEMHPLIGKFAVDPVRYMMRLKPLSSLLAACSP
jgi:hypothetical protein